MSFLMPFLEHVLIRGRPKFNIWSVSWLENDKLHGFLLNISCLKRFKNKRPITPPPPALLLNAKRGVRMCVE